MKNDLISRQAAIDALDGNVIVTSRESAQAVMDYIRGCADRMRSLPSAQPERKTGKWIYGENKYGHDGWQCDQCGHWILWDYHVSMEDAERDLPKYCPSCGARMMQEGEDNG